ncbi:DUF397 domain-containing protein [Streptomyces sp. NPDC003077]|uniref:DUF397 domain-containing protein n=1 Tax=Streptomyces sp. NPDC003077 TaxID=3154443 RepID=UPI0033A32BBF
MGEEGAWSKSSYSGNQGGECVEVAVTRNVVRVRDSKDRLGPVLAVCPADWASFVSFSVRAG